MQGADRGIAAIRGGVALAEMGHYTVARLPGPGGLAALDAICPADLYLREGQMRQTLLLEDDGRIFADLYVCRAKDGALLLSEGPSAAALCERVREGTGHAVEDLGGEVRLLSLTGPYAWELLGKLLGTEVYALPGNHFVRAGRWDCFHAGKTGEYSYLLLVPASDVDGLRAAVREHGAALDVAEAGLSALDHCALESWSFNIRREGRAPGVTPLELQLQWRLGPGRSFPGAEALRARRRAGLRRRLTAVVGAGEMVPGDAVVLDGEPIGEIVNGGFCAARGDFVAMALLDRAYAVAGIDRYAVLRGGVAGAVRTISPPAILPRSLLVVPGQHPYGRRAELDVPSAP